MARRSRNCPICGEVGLPIAYGLPSHDLFQAAELKVVEIGGCIVSPDQPTWWCEMDNYGWDGPDAARAIRVALQQVESTGTPLALD